MLFLRPYIIMIKYLLYILSGILAGVVGGMGMGGGTLLIPILTVFLRVGQKVAQGVNLIAFIPMSVVAIIIHAKNGYIKKEGIWFLIVPAVIASVLASLLAERTGSESLTRFFGGFMILVAFVIFFQDKIKKAK